MILTKEAIFKAHQTGSIVIEPFDPELVQINSIDVRLGGDLWYLKKQACRDIYNPDDSLWKKIKPVPASHIRNVWGDWADGIVPDDAPCFVLGSGEFYIGTTLEKVGTRLKPIPHPLVPEMKAKSTIGRQGLTVALCAGLGDIGYVGRWALEIRVTDDGNVPIAIGTPIAQVVFLEASHTASEYNGTERYQNGENIRFLPKPLKFIGVETDDQRLVEKCQEQLW